MAQAPVLRYSGGGARAGAGSGIEYRGDGQSSIYVFRVHYIPYNNLVRLTNPTEQILRVPSAPGEEVFTGVWTPINKKYDFRPFFIIGDRERLFRRIDSR